jgi:hypothetical protein
MSDLPPEGSGPRQPAGSPATPAAVPHWAVPAVPPAPEVEPPQPATPSVEGAVSSPAPAQPGFPLWANDPAVARVPPPWAGPTAGSQTPAATPPMGWYAPVAAPPPGAPPQGWYAPTAAQAPVARAFQFDRARWLPTFMVAAIVAGVTLGGIGLDKVVAAPSAGTVAMGGSVTITAAPGWVLVSPAGDTSQGIELQKGNAILTAQVVSSSYSGDSASMVSEAKQALGGDSAQISYGSLHHTTIGGHDTTYVAFEAAVASGQHSGIVDGDLVCMVVETNEIIIVAAAPQGHFDPVVDDVSLMLKSVRVGQ